jgi:hypothetical protein
MKLPVSIFPFFLACLVAGCNDKSTEIQTRETTPFSAYTSNCIGLTLARSDGSETDSIFVWSFTDKLIIDFSFLANCCLDSNDSSISRMTAHDTITIAVIDSVDPGCRCPCLYMAHVEVASLPNDCYVVQVRCVVGRSIRPEDPMIHVVNVCRAPGENNDDNIGHLLE